MAEYPKSITTNDGLRMYFKTEAEEITAYLKEPGLFHDKPAGIIEKVAEPVLVPAPVEAEVKNIPTETIAPVVEPVKVEEKRPVGRPAKRRW